MKMYFGLDVHSKTTFVHAQDGEGATIYSGEIATTVEAFDKLFTQLAPAEQTEVAMESGSMTTFVAGIVHAQGLVPVVISAAEVRAKARRVGQKSDSRDAFEICDGWRRGIFTQVVWVPTPEVAELRMLLAARQSFVSDRVSAINRFKALIRGEGLAPKGPWTLTSEKSWEKALKLAGTQGTLAMIAREHFAAWKRAEESVKALTARIEAAVRESFPEEIELLQSVPSVGLLVGAGFLAAIGDVSRFVDSSHVSSYLGLVPSTYDSGGRERHGRITRRGNPYTRALLCQSAQHASQARNPFNPYFRRLAATKGRKRAVVAVANRLARVLYQVLKTKKKFDVKYLGVEFRPEAKTKKVYYHQRKNVKAAC